MQTTTILGMPRKLAWGFLALLLFMTGDGIELGYLSKFLVDEGFTVTEASMVFTIYGITAALSAWLAGVLSEIFGARRVMIYGFLIWAVFHVSFLTLGLGTLNYSLILITYAIRGFGYPLFAYGFLVWVAYETNPDKLSGAYGWFWFCFAGGLGFFGSLVPSFTIPAFGPIGSLWISLIFVGLGGIIAIFMIKERTKSPDYVKGNTDAGKLKEFVKGVTIIFENPRVAAGGIIRAINTTSQYGFFVALPLFYTEIIGLSTAQWLRVWSEANLIHICAALIFGLVGNKFRWHMIVKWWGCAGCAITCLLIYYGSIMLGPNPLLIFVILSLYLIALAAFVPLSAIMPSLEPNRKGTATSILNAGAGLSTVIGPAIVASLYPFFGLEGVIWAFVILYVIAAFLCRYIDAGEKSANFAKTQNANIEENTLLENTVN